MLVWTVFDEETRILAEALAGLPGVEALTGKTKAADRAAILDRFRRGETRVLLSVATVLGFGMNLQCVTAMVFSGFSDSFEALYQAVRRAVRFGQTERVRVHFPVVEALEGDSYQNLQRKQAAHDRAVREMEDNYLAARAAREGAVEP